MSAPRQRIEPLADHQQELGQIERIAASSVLHGSESLCHLLRFLAEKTVTDQVTPVNEYAIAAEVFKRRVNFDPKNDATVRVQMGRLRSRLADYYAGEGTRDHIVVEIPPRSYSVSFLYRNPTPGEPAPPLPPVPPHLGGIDAERPPRGWNRTRAGVIAFGLVLALAVCYFGVRALTGVEHVRVPASMTTFWKDFRDDSVGPLVIFSNAKFVGASKTGLRYFRPNEDSPDLVVDNYTGIGEVMAVDALNHLFFRFGREIRVQRAMKMSWDDAKVSNMIFVGSCAENKPACELPYAPEFVFGDHGITNLHPHAGEEAAFSVAQTLPSTEDLAIISLHSGLVPTRRILILAGGATLGTQAAAEFVCIPSSVQALLSKLHVSPGAPMPNFEAVLRVKVNGGVPVHTDVLAVHGGLK